MNPKRSLPALLLVVTLLAAAAAVPGPARAQAGERCFTETEFCVSGAIREFWEANGGLPVFGFPIGPQQEVAGEDGVARQAQWFERARLELHPENPAPYNVLLGRLGVDRLEQQNRDWQTFPRLDPNDADAENCRYFRETDHQVCGPFLQAFRAYGLSFPNTPGVTFEESLALFGLPISEAATETIDGKEYTVQWFERARFELHPENQPPFNVLFGRLGAEIAAGQGERPGAALEGKVWRLVSYGPLDARTPAANAEGQISFDGANVAGNTGCNSFGGSYQATATTITFGNLISTLRACPEPVAAQETVVLTALRGEVPYTIEGDILRISYDGGNQVLTFSSAPLAAVTGTVTYLQRIALPPQAVIQVQLVDVSRADAPAIVLSSTSSEAGGRQVPFPFELPYDPATIEERNIYAVQARITIDGQLRFISTQRYQVITQGNPTTVEVIVQPV